MASWLKAVVQHQGVVLVCHQALFLSGHRAQRQKTVGDRCRPQRLLCQLKQALLERTPNRRHGAAHHARAGVLAHHAQKAHVHFRHQGFQFFHVLRTTNAAHHEQAIAGFKTDDVRQGHHSYRARAARHRQMVHLVP